MSIAGQPAGVESARVRIRVIAFFSVMPPGNTLKENTAVQILTVVLLCLLTAEIQNEQVYPRVIYEGYHIDFTRM